MLDWSRLDQNNFAINFRMNWGLDGSGEHSNYHQLSKVNFSTKQIMSVRFSLKEVSIIREDESVIKSWSSKYDGSQNTQPLALFPSKEDVD